jgi:hypothetical protein
MAYNEHIYHIFKNETAGSALSHLWLSVPWISTKPHIALLLYFCSAEQTSLLLNQELLCRSCIVFAHPQPSPATQTSIVCCVLLIVYVCEFGFSLVGFHCLSWNKPSLEIFRVSGATDVGKILTWSWKHQLEALNFIRFQQYVLASLVNNVSRVQACPTDLKEKCLSSSGTYQSIVL